MEFPADPGLTIFTYTAEPVIEDRWRVRFGAEEIDQLRSALGEVVSQLDVELPDYLPIGAQYQSWPVDRSGAHRAPMSGHPSVSGLSLSALLSKVLLTFAMEFERDGALPLALSANVVRVLGAQEVRVRDLPALTGLAEMGIANSLSVLEKRRYVTVGTDAGGRTKLARLTRRGAEAQDTYRERGGEIERDWKVRFGERT